MILHYGFDPLCGWCYGFVPAMRRLTSAFPDLDIRLAMPGLVTGERVGPYGEMESYIRDASVRLKAVTGRAPGERFFDLIRRPGVRGDSRPPIAAISAVMRQAPDRALELAHAVIEAHFDAGADLNEPETYADLFAERGLTIDLPDLSADDAAADIMAAGQALGIRQFPTLLAEPMPGRVNPIPLRYDPAELVAQVGQACRLTAATA